MKARISVLLAAGLFCFLATLMIMVDHPSYAVVLLTVAAAVHLAVVLHRYPVIDAFQVITHYAVLALSLVAVFSFVVSAFGLPHGAVRVLVALLRVSWSSPVAYGQAVHYIASRGAALLVGVTLAHLLVQKSWRPQLEAVLTGVFVASILFVPCEFLFLDPVAGVIVEDPASASSFGVAVGMGSLEPSLLLHFLIALAILLRACLARFRQLLRKREGSRDAVFRA